MNIGFDLDGVLYPWQEIIHKYCLDHQYTKNKDPRIFWTRWVKEHNFIIEDLANISEFYTREAPYKGVVEMVNRLVEKHNIYYITCRPTTQQIVSATMKWLYHSGFPQIDNTVVVKEKTEVVKTFRIDAYVEDRIELALSLSDITRVFLVNKPYNMAWKEPASITRINSVLDIEKYFTAKEKVKWAGTF